MSNTEDEIIAAVKAEDPAGVAAVLRGLSEARRGACNRAIQERIRGTFDHDGEHVALGVAGLGVAQGPQQAARVLERIRLSDHAQLAARVLAERRPRWLADFSHRAITGRGALNGGWRIVRALIRTGEIPKPDLPEYITRIPAALGGIFANDPTIRDGLLADAGLLEDEVFRLFSVEGAAAAMHTVDGHVERHPQRPFGTAPVPKPHLTWRVTLACLANEGHIERARLIDACLGAFFCDLPAAQLTWYIGFHNELEPCLDELADRAQTYLRLLAGAAGPPVALAQRVLERLLATDRLDPGAFVAAAGPPLYRREKKHVIGQLRLLDRTARRNPALADEIGLLVAIALEHGQLDVQEHALALLERHRDSFGAVTLDRLREAAAAIAPGLRARAADVLGSLPKVPEALSMVPVAVATPLAPPRVADVRELAETVAELVADPWDPMLTERTLDGVARFAADYETFVRALEPVVDRVQDLDHLPQLRFLSWMLQPDRPAEQRRANFQKGWTVRVEPFWPRPDRRRGASPGSILGRRLHEVYTQGWRADSRPLMAFPDTATGHVDPDRIIAQMTRLEEAGSPPWRADLLQVLLRLPRDIDTAVARRARGLRSPAGSLLADVLAAGAVADPSTTVADAASATVVTLRPDADPPGQVLPLIWGLTDPFGTTWETWYAEAAELLIWAYALPSHREVAAAHALPVLSRARLPGRIHGPLERFVALLPDLQGPAGTAIGLALAYAMAAHEPSLRAAAIEALIGFSRRSDLDTANLGTQVGDLASRKVIVTSRMAECLETAATSGATEVVWEITRAALPALLKSRARDSHRLLSIASDAAARLGVRGRIDGLADVAATPGSSRLVVTARRLQAQLSG